MRKNMRRRAILLVFAFSLLLVISGAFTHGFLQSAAMASGTSGTGENEADGNKIESIHIHWVSYDTVDDSAPDNLYIRTSSDSELTMQYQIDVSFSGQVDYEPGAIRITIPYQIWHERLAGSEDGETNKAGYGTLSYSVPDASVTSTDWHYEVNEDGSRSIVNTKTIGATSKAMFQFTVLGIIPHKIVDENISDPVVAHCEVVTHEGNTIWLDSNPITAQIDTQEIITGAYKSGVFYEDSDSVPASVLANLPAGADPKKYVYARWWTYSTFSGNQNFSLDVQDNGSIKVDGEYDPAADLENYVGCYKVIYDDEGNEAGLEWVAPAIMLGAQNGGSIEDNKWGKDVLTKTYTTSNGTGYGTYIWTAYSTDDMEWDTTYRMRNQSYWTLTEQDREADYPEALGGTDPKYEKTLSAKDSVTYVRSKWEYPPGRFMVFKYTEQPEGHKHSTHTADQIRGANHQKDYTYEMALNRLRNGQDVEMQYEVLSVGYGYIFTCGPLANQVIWYDLNGGKHTEALDKDQDENHQYDQGWNSAEWAEDPEHYLNWYYVMDTTDRWNWFQDVSGTPESQLIKSNSDDYEFLGVTIAAPEMFTWNKSKNPAYYYSNNGSVFGFIPDDSIAKPAVELWVELDNDADGSEESYLAPSTDAGSVSDGNWHYVGTYQVNSGIQYIDFAELGLTGVTGYRTHIASNQAATKLAVYPHIKLKASERVLDIVENLFAQSETPSTTYRNDDMMYVDLYHHAERPDEVHPNQEVFLPEDIYTHLYIWGDNSRATLTGAGYGAVPSKSVRFNRFEDNDVVNKQVTLHYSAYVDEITNLTSVDRWREAVELGAVKEEKSGVWYDLLPEGVIPIVDSVKLREGDTKLSVDTYPDWKGTGRILMVVRCDLKAKPGRYNSNRIVSDRPSISFDATYTWIDINNIASHLVNYIAFESGDDVQLGTLSGRIGEPDAMILKNNNYTPNREPADIVAALTDLDPNSDEARFVYAKADVNLTVDQMAATEYAKTVMKDLDGIWTQGLEGQQQVNLYEGQAYTYRLRVASAKDTITSEMVMYDSIENYLIPDGSGPQNDATKQADHDEVESKKDWDGDWDRKTVTVGAEGYEQEIEVGGQWRGKLTSIDLNEFIAKGCKPVIYYATQPWLQFGDSTGSIVDESIFFNYEGRYDLTDSTTWTRTTDITNGVWTVPDGVEVTAIALDLRKRADGGDFQLGSLESCEAYLHMVAPDDHRDESQWHAKGAYAHKNEDGTASANDDIDWDAAMDPVNNMHAYNNTRLIARVTYSDGGAYSYLTMIRNDYTKVGIMPQIIQVKKIWNDDEDHDAKRPESVTVTMKRKLQGAAGDYEVVYDEITHEPVTLTLPVIVTDDEGNEREEWEGIFYQTDVVDENGTKYLYTFEEEEIDGYTSSLVKIDDSHFTLNNTHENEKTQVSGEKKWMMPDGRELPAEIQSLVPARVTVNLYRTGSSGEKEFVRSTEVTPDSATNEWKYLFTDLDRYERGGYEYIYSVEEAPVDYFWSSTSDPAEMPDGYTVPFEYDPDAIDVIYNFYIPYGDLSVTKKIEGATSVSKEQKFTYSLSLMVQGEEQEVPADGTFDYTIYDVTGEGTDETLTEVSTGTIGHGETFTLKGGQRIIIKKIPSNAHFTLSEEEVTGWTLTDSVNTEGNIPTVNEIAAEFTNTYSASGNVNVKVNKKLTGHTMIKNKFRFDLVDDNPESGTYQEVIRPGYSPAVTGTRDPADNSLTVIGEVAFAGLTYTEADAGKTFKYIVREQIPEEATDNGDGTYTYKGYTYTKKDYPVKVEVVDNGDGTLKVTPYYQDGSDWKQGSEFTYMLENTYEAEGEIDFQAWKVLEVYDLEEGQFEFELYHYDTVLGDKVGDPIEVVTNDAEGITHFSKLHFDQNDVSDDPENPREYVYLIREKHGDDPTVIYSHKEYIIHVKPFDNNDGTISFAQDNQTAEREYVEIECPECGGTGEAETVQITSYIHPTTGYVQPLSDAMRDALCSACHGIGMIKGMMCEQCKGTGWPIGATFKLYGSVVTITKHAFLNAQNRYGAYYTNSSNSNTGHIATVADGSTGECSTCDGLGYTYEEGGINVSGETSGPVFTNGYRNGSLSVTKLTRNGDPSQEFHFHIQLTGPNLVDGKIEYELDQVENGTVVVNGPAKATRVPLLGAGITELYHAATEELQGKAYAVLNRTTGLLTFFRSDITNLFDPVYNRLFTMSGTRTENGNYIYYTGFEEKTVSDSETSGSSYPSPWHASDKDLINEVNMVGAVKPKTTWGLFRQLNNVTKYDLHLLDTSLVKNMGSMFYENYALKELDISMLDLSNVVNCRFVFYKDRNLEILNMGNTEFAQFSNKQSFFYENNKLQMVTISDDFRLNTGSYSVQFPTPPTTDPYDGLWHNQETGEALTATELFTGGNHGGTWGWEDPAYYNIKLFPGKNDAGTNATGSMPDAQNLPCKSDYSFRPSFYLFAYKISGMRDKAGNFYPVDEEGYITIPAGTYSRDQEVELTAEWEKADTSSSMENGRIDLILHGGEMATFKDIPAGTAYEVWEDTPDGWILISKVDDSGKIVPLETADAVFTNEYAPNKATASMTASKIFDGELTERKFTFGLYKVEGSTETLIEEKQNSDGGVASFSVITYDYNNPGDVGTHNYIIREIVTNQDETITYDTHKERVTVEVVDDGKGNITATTTYEDGNAVFVNDTKPGNLKISKIIIGASAKSGEQEFKILAELTDKKGAPLAGDFAAVRIDKEGAESPETVTFTDGRNEITLKGGESLLIKDIPAGASYTLTEQELTDGWSQTGTAGESGTINPTVTSEASFTNTYAAEGSADLKAEKQVEGEVPEGEAYTFELFAADDKFNLTGDALQTKTNNPVDTAETITVDETEIPNPDYNKSMVLFDTITYTEEGTYYYVIREKADAEDSTIITDSRELHVTVVVKDEEGAGKLTAQATYQIGGESSNIFLNTRKDGMLKISKTIADATEVSAEQAFTFTVALNDKNGKPVSKTFKAVRTDKDGNESEVDGGISFSNGETEITLKGGETLLIKGLPHGAEYSLEEEGMDCWTQTEASGVTGKITGDQTSEASFENTYSANGSMTLNAKKKTDPADLGTPEKAFSFIILQGSSELERVDNDASGEASFSPINYMLKDVGKTFTYTIQEQTSVNLPTDIQYAFDSAKYTVTVTVEDNGDGTLKAEPVITKDGKTVDEVIFTNTGRVDIPVRKKWEGDSAVVGDIRPDRVMVQLVAEYKDGTSEVVASRAISTGNATEEGGSIWETRFVGLPTIKDGQEIKYSVKEVTPSNYCAAYSKDGNTLVLVNTYAETSLEFGGVKKLENKKLEAGMFSFILEPVSEGAPMPENSEVQCDEDGNFSFGDIIFRLGNMNRNEDDELVVTELIYKIREVIPEGAVQTADETQYVFDSMLYDAQEYEVKVTLSYDVDNAELTAKADKKAPEIVFTNTDVRTGITVTKEWLGDREGGTVKLDLYTVEAGQYNKVDPQPEYTKDGNVYSFDDLPGLDKDGNEIVYAVKEQHMSGFVTTYRNSGENADVDDAAFDGGTIINENKERRYRFTFTKKWSGETGDSIDWVLYDSKGNVAHKKFNKKVISKTEWYYEAWFSTDEEYYLVEKDVEGFRTYYENMGAHEGEDGRCYNGGTIINTKIPKTGDSANLLLWLSMVLFGTGLAGGTMYYRRRRSR